MRCHEELNMTIRLNGKIHNQTYHHGEPDAHLPLPGKHKAGNRKSASNPAPKLSRIFIFFLRYFGKRLRELSFLNSGIQISLKDERDNKQDIFATRVESKHSSATLTKKTKPINSRSIYFKVEKDRMTVELPCNGMTVSMKKYSAHQTIFTKKMAAHIWLGFAVH